MEEKETTVSGSLPDSDTDSPPPVSGVALAPPPQVPMNINMNMAVDSTINAKATPTSNGGGSGGGVDLSGKKKRGRPRKYDSDGNLRVKPFHHALPSGGGGLSSPESFSITDSKKGGRGRPTGSGNWQLLAALGELFANTAGGDFTPHVVTVHTGEDVAGKILSFAEKGERGICILSANGAVSNVTIRQPGSAGGILTYEGRFEILSLSGSLTVSGNGGVRSRTGGLSVSLASPDGRIIGGGIAGLLLAASPIQIVMGSFMPNGYKVHKRKYNRQHNVKPIAQAKPDEEKNLIMVSESESPLLLQQQSYGETTENSENDIQIPNPTNSYVASCWNGSHHPTSDHRPSPDINVSVLHEEEDDSEQGVL